MIFLQEEREKITGTHYSSTHVSSSNQSDSDSKDSTGNSVKRKKGLNFVSILPFWRIEINF